MRTGFEISRYVLTQIMQRAEKSQILLKSRSQILIQKDAATLSTTNILLTDLPD
jgi:hypothetical protein